MPQAFSFKCMISCENWTKLIKMDYDSLGNSCEKKQHEKMAPFNGLPSISNTVSRNLLTPGI